MKTILIRVGCILLLTLILNEKQRRVKSMNKDNIELQKEIYRGCFHNHKKSDMVKFYLPLNIDLKGGRI